MTFFLYLISESESDFRNYERTTNNFFRVPTIGAPKPPPLGIPLSGCFHHRANFSGLAADFYVLREGSPGIQI
jgi:hypothetical protein